jgi:hypothetical protein
MHSIWWMHAADGQLPAVRLAWLTFRLPHLVTTVATDMSQSPTHTDNASWGCNCCARLHTAALKHIYNTCRCMLKSPLADSVYANAASMTLLGCLLPAGCPGLGPAVPQNAANYNCPLTASGGNCSTTCLPGFSLAAGSSLQISCSLGNWSTPTGICINSGVQQ